MYICTLEVAEEVVKYHTEAEHYKGVTEEVACYAYNLPRKPLRPPHPAQIHNFCKTNN